MRRLWAVYCDHASVYYFWLFSAACATVGFCAWTLTFAFCIVPADDEVLFPYVSFLFAALCYAPLLSMIEDRRDGTLEPVPFDWSVCFLKWLVLFMLFRTAVSVWWMFMWTAATLGWNGTHLETIANISTLWLAVHCTVFDLIIWGTSWFKQHEPVMAADEVQWPRIELRAQP